MASYVRLVPRTLLLGSVLLLAGCAGDAIRIGRAESMVSAGRAAGEATEGLMQRTRASNREVLIDIVAADPNCNFPRPAIMSGDRPRGTLYCRPGGFDQQRYPRDWQMQRITERDFKATLGVIGALSGYLDLIDGIVQRDPLDLGAEFANIASDLDTIKGAAEAVSGSTVGIPSLSDDQSDAIDGALDLISTILDERNRVDEMRAVETAENRQLFTDTLTSLRSANRDWATSLERQVRQRRALLEDRLARLSRAGEAQRRPAAEALLTAIEEQESLSRLLPALNDVTDKLQQSHTAYLALLDDPNAELTRAERARLAQLNHDRVMGALRSLTALIRAF